MRHSSRAIALACLFAATVLSAPAWSATPAAGERQPLVVPDAEQRLMTASGSGRQYQVFVAAPSQPAAEGGYPVLYVLDGNAMFLTTVEAVRAYERRRDKDGGLRALVVGIGYPPGTDIPSARTYDLSRPTSGPAGPNPTGGAADFLDFIERDLKPAIARDYPVDPQRQALLGHSFGGRFVLDTLTRSPESFQTWVAMSSSFWFDDHALLPQIEAFASERRADAAPVRVLLTVGEYEGRPAPGAWADDPERAARAAEALRKRGQVTHARETAERLAATPRMLVDLVEIAGEDHGTVIPASIGRGVDFVLTGPEQVPAVPTAAEYLALGPEGRYRLRMQVRALPDPHRIPWLNRLQASLRQGLDKATHQRLHQERQDMDARYGSVPHKVNADP